MKRLLAAAGIVLGMSACGEELELPAYPSGSSIRWVCDSSGRVYTQTLNVHPHPKSVITCESGWRAL